MRDATRLSLAVALLLAEAAVAVAALHPHVGSAYRAFFIDHTANAWPPCHPAPSQIPRETVILPERLSPAGACALLRSGWSRPESWGVWNQGAVARLAVPYTPDIHRLEMTLIAHARPGHAQHVIVRVNGRNAGRFVIGADLKITIAVPLPAVARPRIAHVELHISAPYSPLEAGEGSDPRDLGIGLISLRRR